MMLSVNKGNNFMINRRHLLITAGSSIALATLPKAIAGPQTNITNVLEKKSRQQQYSDKIGDLFIARNDKGSNSLKLKHVESGPKCEGLEQFRLVFTSETTNLPDDIYSVTHLATLKTQKINIEASHSIQKHFVASFSLLA